MSRIPTLDEIREAAKFLPDPNNLSTREIRDAFKVPHVVLDGSRVVITVEGKRMQFDVCHREGNWGEKVWFYYGAVDVSGRGGI